MKNLKVGKKLILAFGTVLILFVISVIAVSISLNHIRQELNEFYNVPWQTRGAAQDLQANLAQQQKSLFRVIATTDNKIKASALSDVDTYGKRIEENIALIQSKALAENMGIVDNLKAKIASWNAVKDNVLGMVADSHYSGSSISQYIQENAASILQEVDAALADTVNKTNETGEQLISQTAQAQTAATLLLLIMCSVSILTGLILCFAISRSITAPLREIEAAADKMAQGTLQISIGYTSKDELGRLAESMRTMAQRISYYMGEITDATKQLASGDLNVKAREPFLGDFLPVQLSIRTLVGNLNRTMMGINQTADQVAGGAEQVSSGAQALSQGATEQASSVETLSATINEIAGQTKTNAQSAVNARETVDGVGEKLLESNRRMQDMTKAMDEISQASSEIGKIIKTIEDIAFQTNILALNAAVEAARAGAAGKGFAVVADEVRNLASKSSEASKSTSALIERSLKAVENGTSIAKDTASSLLTVVDGTKEITQQVSQIAQASEEQAASVAQVTQGIDEISSVVQTNSATAQQSAASSEELSSQAQVLKNLVGQFRLKGAPSGGIPAAPERAAVYTKYE